MIHNYDSLTIHYWMISKLKLEQLELLVFAFLFKNASCGLIEWAPLAENISLFEGILNKRITCDMLTQVIRSLEKKELVISYEDDNTIMIKHQTLRKIIG